MSFNGHIPKFGRLYSPVILVFVCRGSNKHVREQKQCQKKRAC